MSSSNVWSAYQRLCRRAGLDEQRTLRAVEFSVVGATGAVIDLGLTVALFAYTHYLAANTLGFLAAVTWNFAGNWLVVFDRPNGRLRWQYFSYVALHAGTFGLRAVVIAGLVELTLVGATPATVIGIGVAAVANFLGTEKIFAGVGQLWFDAVAALNQLAHSIYGSRLRAILKATGLYHVLYRTYELAVGLLYRDDTYTIHAGGETAPIHTEHAPEVVSVLHTIENEGDVLDQFIRDLEPEDVVWDIGANLGVFAAPAARRVTSGHVVAVEPFRPTADRLKENLALADVEANTTVVAAALGDEFGDIELALERAELGTQTPSTTDDAPYTRIVPQRQGDYLVQDLNHPSPTVLKVDVEGAEQDVLNGFLQALDETVRLAYIETHDDDSCIEQHLEARGFEVETERHGGQTYLRAERGDL